jgi:alkylresorcinol/alkylpyrone synthase
VVLRCGGGGPSVVARGEHTWPNSLDIMGWDVAADGLKAIFSRDIPRLVATELATVVQDFLGRHNMTLGEIAHFVCHPGGPKVIDAYEAVFGAGFIGAAEARQSLRDYGNMSAVSVMFVLEQMLAAGTGGNRALMTSLGPGFSAGFVVLDRT